MRGGGFFPVCWQTAIRALLIMSVVCCSGPRLGAGDATTQVVDQRLVTELSACLSRGHGLKLRGHFEALAVRGRSVLGKLRALHDECPRDSAQRLSLAMACLVCGDVSNERLSELTIGVCSGDADRTEVTAVALQAWSRPLVDPVRRLVSDDGADAGSRLQGACLLAQWEDAADSESLWRRPGTAVFVVEQLSYMSGLHLAACAELLRPQAVHWVPEACRRILGADAGGERNLMALLATQQELAIPRLRRVLERRAPYWPDELEFPALPDADAAVRQQIQAGAGRIGERWAFCADIRFTSLQPLLESLRGSGYRPIRVRPHNGVAEQDPRMSVVWVRDGRRWELVFGQQAHELPARRQNAARNGLVPADVCLISGAGPYSGWLSVWEEPEAEGEQRRVVYGVTAAELKELEEQFYFAESEREVDFSSLSSLFSYSSESGERLYCAVFSSLGPLNSAVPAVSPAELPELAGKQQPLLDITWSPAAATEPADLRRKFQLDAAETEPWPGEEPPDQDLRLLRTRALFGTGQTQQILAELENLTAGEYSEDLLVDDLVRLRCLAYGQLGKIEEASLLQQQFAQLVYSQSQEDSLGISLLACWSTFEAVQKLIAEGRGRCEAGADYYALACGTALAGRFLQQRDAVRESEQLRATAVQLLQQAVTDEQAFCDLDQLVNEGDLMDLHQSAEFRQIRQRLIEQSRFAVVSAWEETGRESMVLMQPSAAELREAVVESEQAGWRPVGIIASREEESGFSLLLHRPTVDAERLRTEQSLQGAAAHALLRLRQTDAVLSALAETSNAAIGSYLLRRMQRYAMDVRVLLKILAENQPAGIRRTIVQGLGELASGKLIPAADQNAVRAILLKLYAEDSDPGVHSA
ncbi:MAG: Serine/threonine-protein kinase PknB, partial [Planctomycetota bacterium]